jgi:hypothetical protein
MFHRIKRWHWIVLSLVVGSALGLLNQLAHHDWDTAYGDSISQAQFVKAIAERQPDGRPNFYDLVVYPDESDNGKGEPRKPVHIVAGQFWTPPAPAIGRPDPIIYRRCFVAQIPFAPEDTEATFTAQPTVMKYLNIQKVRYRYAWWRDPKIGISLCTGASFLVIGLIWPTFLNLLAYGSVFLPAEEKGINLSKVSSGPSLVPVQPELTDQELSDLEKLEKEMEENLAQSETADVQPQKPAVPDAIKSLSADVAPAAPELHPDHPDFVKRKEDFYPTARVQPTAEDKPEA